MPSLNFSVLPRWQELFPKTSSAWTASPVKLYPDRVNQKPLGQQEETEMVRNIPVGTKTGSWTVMREKYDVADTGQEETIHSRVSSLLVFTQGLMYSG